MNNKIENWHPELRKNGMISAVLNQIDNDFVNAVPSADLSFVSKPFHPWLHKAYKDIENNVDNALAIAIAILDEIGFRYAKDEYWVCSDEFSENDDVCLSAIHILTKLFQKNESLYFYRATLDKLSGLTKYSFFKSDDCFDINKFISEGCRYQFRKNWKPI